jgi:ribosome-associated protein
MVAIADAVQESLREERLRPAHVEGYPRQEWILLDYGSFVVHLFTPRMRTFYDLERLWGGATRVEVAG